ncbi:MAG TPA: hypothetical protein ENK07_03035, partial [Bacteroidetes bacterium]|nr:hypothetical protein [Bacteroidota bacterium]
MPTQPNFDVLNGLLSSFAGHPIVAKPRPGLMPFRDFLAEALGDSWTRLEQALLGGAALAGGAQEGTQQAGGSQLTAYLDATGILVEKTRQNGDVTLGPHGTLAGLAVSGAAPAPVAGAKQTGSGQGKTAVRTDKGVPDRTGESVPAEMRPG